MWNEKLSKMGKASKPFWNIVREIKKPMVHIPALKVGDQLFMSDLEKANMFAETFYENQVNASNNVGNLAIEISASDSINYINSVLSNEIDIVSINDLQIILHNLKTRKAMGFDNIKNLYLKNLPPLGFKFLQSIFNACFRLGYFPNAWKTAKVIPILKPGKQANNPTHYRPISLLSSLSKCFEKIIKNKVTDFINRNEILPPEQFGFRPFHSTVHQVHRITRHVKQNFRFGKSTGMVLLDVEKAFDSLWHDGLLHKMLILNFPMYLIRIIKSFLAGRNCVVSVNKTSSNSFSCVAGVPQGSVLGPALFTIFTHDFPKLPNCETAIFADDTCIFSTDSVASVIESNLQSALNILQNYFTDWKIKINASKSQAIFFTRKRKPCFLPSSMLVFSNSICVGWQSSAKYLGVHLDSKLTFGLHVQETLKKVNLAIKLLYPFINRRSRLSNENKLLIYKSIFQAIIFYGSPAWSNCAVSHIRRLQISQNKILKMMLNLPWCYSTNELHSVAKIERVSCRILKLNEKYLNSCLLSENALISSIAS